MRKLIPIVVALVFGVGAGLGSSELWIRVLSSDLTQTKTADAIVEGQFDAKFSHGCWGPKFRIFASKVELTSAIEDFKPPESTGPVVRLKH